jgi:hypothetical protein
MLIKFTGDFKDLKPMGFTFHKLYARNYKVYEKSKVWIWVAHGGYVEIDDFFSLSGYIVKAIWDGTFPVYEKDAVYNDMLFFKKGDRKACMINQKTGEIIERREFTKRYCDENQEYDYDLFREVSIYNETLHFIEELKDLNIFEIVEK